jgi:hypothetical protein
VPSVGAAGKELLELLLPEEELPDIDIELDMLVELDMLIEVEDDWVVDPDEAWLLDDMVVVVVLDVEQAAANVTEARSNRFLRFMVVFPSP